MNKKPKLVVKPTSAREILSYMPTEEEVKVQIPLTDVSEVLVDFDIENDNNLEITKADSVVLKMDDKHAWAIFMDTKLIQRVEEDGIIQNYLIGYENGLQARQNETHFSQKENDPICHRVIFQPEPTFISYSFFYGFFGKTIENMCLSLLEKNTEFNISLRKEVLEAFCDKYTFSFPKNPELSEVMYDYAEILIENIIDIQAKVGE